MRSWSFKNDGRKTRVYLDGNLYCIEEKPADPEGTYSRLVERFEENYPGFDLFKALLHYYRTGEEAFDL